MKRALAVGAIVPALLLGSCATDGTHAADSAGAWYSDYYDPWYWGGGGWVYPPDIAGPPHPEHPIVLPPGSAPRPEHPIATPPSASVPTPTPPIASQPSRPTASPRPAPMPRPAMRGGGGRR
jgi:hypothetical protein